MMTPQRHASKMVRHCSIKTLQRHDGAAFSHQNPVMA
jgi:hypothetical protein